MTKVVLSRNGDVKHGTKIVGCWHVEHPRKDNKDSRYVKNLYIAKMSVKLKCHTRFLTGYTKKELSNVIGANL